MDAGPAGGSASTPTPSAASRDARDAREGGSGGSPAPSTDVSVVDASQGEEQAARMARLADACRTILEASGARRQPRAPAWRATDGTSRPACVAPPPPSLTAAPSPARSPVSLRAQCLGEDPEREGLRKTPMRVAKSLLSLTSGYAGTPAAVVGDALFSVDARELVLVRDIDVFSLCEHHLLPFFGRAHVGYLPAGRVVGLSKLARLVDLFAKRLQVQERLTQQIADAVQEATGARGVAVVIEAT